MSFNEVGSLFIGCALVCWLAYGFIFESNVSQPNYINGPNLDGIETRVYKSLDVITVSNNEDSQSFRLLFNYISGSNQKANKIPMTAPVIEYNSKMMFILPKMDSIPKPNNENVKIKSITNLTVAIKKFKGSSKKSKIILRKLQSELKGLGVKVPGEWYLAQYNSPWVFPLFRKNEIWVVIKNESP